MNIDDDKLARLLAIPSAYATIKLGMKLHPKQKAALDSLFKDKKVVFRSSNNVGKTSVLLTAAILYAIDVRKSMCVSTAAVFRQITAQLMPNLKRYQHLYPKWQFNTNSIVVDGVQKYLGFSSGTDSAAFQGFHLYEDTELFVAVDESAGVASEVFEQIDRCNPSFLLVAGSPLGPEGEFYRLETDENAYKLYKHFHLRQDECLKTDGWWIEQKDIDYMIAKWGNNHPLTLSSIYGEFAKDSENTIISLSSYNKCINSPPEYVNGDMCAALDFAAGNDSNVLALRRGNKVEIIKTWTDKDTMAAALEFSRLLNDLKLQYNLQPNQVVGDASGLGKPILDRLNELGWRCNYFFGQEKPKDENYKNAITELWLEFSKKIVNCQVILPQNEDLKGQLLSRQQRLNASGKMELESKAEMKTRGLPSPDIADAIAMSYYKPNSGNITFLRPYSPKEKTYSIM